jgi:hypothetical protein
MSDDLRLSGRVGIQGGDAHRHAARRLRAAFPSLDWIDLDPGADAPSDLPVITLAQDASKPEGSFTLSAGQSGVAPRISITGGPFSGVIYGAEELIQRRASAEGAAVAIESGTVSQEPGLAYRTWWNWDHSTNWDLEQIGVQEVGVMNPYGKPPAGFLDDFKTCVDFMSMHRVGALVIYGFLRDSHGGTEAAQELCRYAAERGVRILPGVANLAYGGIYWEGDHEFNLGTWLRKHPHLAATMERPIGFQIPGLGFPLSFPRSEYGLSGCPSKPENQQWMQDGIAWLTETFDLGGINFEAGDYGVCGCPECSQRRADREDAQRREGYAESWSHADMADFFPRLYETAISRKPDLWMYSELQWDNLLDSEAHGDFLSVLPKGGIYQHTLNRPYWDRVKQELTAGYVRGLPTDINVFRCQFACQWGGDRRTERYFFNGRIFEAQAKKAKETAIDGLTIWGEPSPFHTSVELSYLAYARFAWDPELTWDQFLTEEAAPRLGGVDAAVTFIDLMTELDEHPSIDAARLRAMRAATIDGLTHADDGIARRWTWLANRIDQRRYMDGVMS